MSSFEELFSDIVKQAQDAQYDIEQNDKQQQDVKEKQRIIQKAIYNSKNKEDVDYFNERLASLEQEEANLIVENAELQEKFRRLTTRVLTLKNAAIGS